MKKLIYLIIVIVVIIGGVYLWQQQKVEGPTVSVPAGDQNQEVNLRPAELTSVDLSNKTIQAVEVQTSAQYTVSAEKATIFSYTDDPKCEVSCAQPESLVKIDSRIKNGETHGYELKGKWSNINGQNVFEASEIGWKL